MLIVSTEGSRYAFTDDMSHVMRMPRKSPLPGATVNDLRQDWDWIPVRSYETIEVGKPMTLWLDIRRDGVRTLRRTTLVTDMEAA
jgi:hypothetical protein